jgi:hypothetical protein
MHGQHVDLDRVRRFEVPRGLREGGAHASHGELPVPQTDVVGEHAADGADVLAFVGGKGASLASCNALNKAEGKY